MPVLQFACVGQAGEGSGVEGGVEPAVIVFFQQDAAVLFGEQPDHGRFPGIGCPDNEISVLKDHGLFLSWRGVPAFLTMHALGCSSRKPCKR